MLFGEKAHVPDTVSTYLGFNNLFPPRRALVSGWQDLSVFPLIVRPMEGLPDIWPLTLSSVKNWVPRSSDVP